MSSAARRATNFPGSIYVTIEQAPEVTSELVVSTADALVPWLEDWIRGSAQQHNLQKLSASGYSEQHLFVLLPGFTTAPFDVADRLMRSDAPLPGAVLTLPGTLTNVWLMSTWSTGDLFHYGPRGWMRSRKVFEY